MAKKLKATVPCLGCKTENTILVIKPNHFGSTHTKMTCSHCGSRVFLRVSKTGEKDRVKLEQALLFLSDKLKSILDAHKPSETSVPLDSQVSTVKNSTETPIVQAPV